MHRKSIENGCSFQVNRSLVSFVLAAIVIFGLSGFYTRKARADSPQLEDARFNAASMPSRTLEVHYRVNEESLPLSEVQVWITANRGASWRLSGLDGDRQSPAVVTLPGEGLFGICVVARNEVGLSSAPPAGEASARQWVFVDDQPPVVQLHEARLSHESGHPTLLIRWTVLDANLPQRPMEISFQRPPDGPWHPVGGGALPNTGRYDWPLPADLTGPLTLRVSATDRVGHRVESELQTIEISPELREVPPSTSPLPHPAERNGASAVPAQPRLSAMPVWGSAREAALRRYAEGLTHRDEGRLREAVLHFREAVRLDPRLVEAMAQTGLILYGLGDLDGALTSFEATLAQEPTMRDALRGAALVYRKQERYDLAARHLRTILRYNPADAEVWMNLGDVAVFQGDEVLARDCYKRAMQMNPAATQVVEDAAQRLALMSEFKPKAREGGR